MQCRLVNVHRAVQCTLYTYTVQYRVTCVLYTVQCSVHYWMTTNHFGQHTVHTVNCTLYSVQCSLHSTYWTFTQLTLNIYCTYTQFTLYTALYNALFTRYIVQCNLHTAHSKLHDAHCTMHTAQNQVTVSIVEPTIARTHHSRHNTADTVLYSNEYCTVMHCICIILRQGMYGQI